MARTGALTGGTNVAQTTSEDLNGPQTDLLIDGVVGTVGNTSGVAPMTGGLSVNAQGTPNNTTAIGAGTAYVTATPTSQGSQRLRVKIDAQNYTHPSNTSGGTVYDYIYVAVSPTLAANPDSSMATVGTISVARSTVINTPPVSPPTYAVLIAVVTLANSFTTVTSGNIADKRVQTGSTAAAIVPGTSVAKNAKNDYKFSVYRAAALTPTGVVGFDTKEFDTGSNVDIVTNKGRFTAPVAGFYWFSAQLRYTSTTSVQNFGIKLYKNGVQAKDGSMFVQMYTSATSIVASNVSAMIQLAANDYVEVYALSDSTEALSVANAPADNYFQGFLISAA